MSLHRQVAHGTIIQIGGKVASTLLGFVAIALMTRALGAEQFGWYVTAASFLQFVGVFSDFGFTLTTSNMLSEGEFERSSLFNTIFTWRVITSFFFQGLAPLIFLAFPFVWPIKLAVIIMSTSFFFQALNQVFIGLYREQLRMVNTILGEVVGRVVLVLSVAGVAFGHYGFIWMMVAITLASICSTFYYWRAAPTIRFELNPAVGRALFHKMWPTAVAIIFNSLYYQAGRVLLPLYVPQAEVGLFGAALRVYDIVVQVAALLMGMLMPLITFAWARRMMTDFRDRLQMSLNLMTLLLFPLITGMIMLGTPLMILVAGADFAASGAMLSLISIALFGACFGMIFGHVVLAINRQRAALTVYIAVAIISLGAFWYAIPRFGVWGAGSVMIISELLAGAGLTFLALSASRAIPSFVAFIKIVLASGVMAIYLYYTPTLPVLVHVATGALVYAVMIFTLRVTTWKKVRPLLTKS